MAAEKLYDIWAKRNPNWEKRYEDSVNITADFIDISVNRAGRHTANRGPFQLNHLLCALEGVLHTFGNRLIIVQLQENHSYV